MNSLHALETVPWSVAQPGEPSSYVDRVAAVDTTTANIRENPRDAYLLGGSNMPMHTEPAPIDIAYENNARNGVKARLRGDANWKRAFEEAIYADTMHDGGTVHEHRVFHT